MTKTHHAHAASKAALQAAGAGIATLFLTLGNAHASGTKQQTFEVPEQAAEALSSAWHGASKPALLAIFGPSGMKLVSSGDPVAEKMVSARLAAEYDSAHRIEDVDGRKALLILGQNEFPYPIPIVKEGNAWHFDTRAGEQEILDRRIGRNELNAIKVCRTYVEAQREFAEMGATKGMPEYASKVVSSANRHDGLYWPAKTGEPQSPLGPLFAHAATEGYGKANAMSGGPYHGYYYKIITQQGTDAQGGAINYAGQGHLIKGFALVAFPSKYGDSGIMSFIVNQHGIVFEKNLGPDTASIAKRINVYNPDRSWKPVAD